MAVSLPPKVVTPSKAAKDAWLAKASKAKDAFVTVNTPGIRAILGAHAVQLSDWGKPPRPENAMPVPVEELMGGLPVARVNLLLGRASVQTFGHAVPTNNDSTANGNSSKPLSNPDVDIVITVSATFRNVPGVHANTSSSSTSPNALGQSREHEMVEKVLMEVRHRKKMERNDERNQESNQKSNKKTNSVAPIFVTAKMKHKTALLAAQDVEKALEEIEAKRAAIREQHAAK
ncbi:hypothetical protein QC763_0019270 [Podospora pseudopauciseta]|uniref:Uncharacterized protein n=1 Tax=Podospora pseudopauciseta TaxID=2093780 RepID=A0ABR0I0R6_9PEZI|nr:hypothetical protein QC763_0019270 [Podospora pseudopauciseta]